MYKPRPRDNTGTVGNWCGFSGIASPTRKRNATREPGYLNLKLIVQSLMCFPSGMPSLCGIYSSFKTQGIFISASEKALVISERKKTKQNHFQTMLYVLFPYCH